MCSDIDGSLRSGALSMQGRRVLIVEDNPVNQELARAMLEAIGVIADVASNGLEALQVQETKPYHLIFMDCDMPVMDGFQAARAIRKSECLAGKEPSIIVALTGMAEKEALDRCAEAGMNDCLARPFSVQAMREMLLRWLCPDALEVGR